MAKKKPYRFVLYLAARAAAAVVCILPRRAALALARGAGWLSYALVKRQRTKILESLRKAYRQEKSGDEIRRLARKVFQHAAQTVVEVLRFPGLTREKLKTMVDAGEAIRLYESLLKEGRGVLSITAHLGNWELLAGVICIEGFSGAVVARRVYYEPYNEWIVGLRRSVKVRTIYRDQSAREILELLAANQIIGLLPDQDIHGIRGVFVDFFGRPAYTPVAPVRLALASGSPIVANFLVREPGDRYRVVLGSVIRPVVEGGAAASVFQREEAVKKYTAQWMTVFEKIIRQYPEQWAWMHDRWKTRAADERTETKGARHPKRCQAPATVQQREDILSP